MADQSSTNKPSELSSSSSSDERAKLAHEMHNVQSTIREDEESSSCGNQDSVCFDASKQRQIELEEEKKLKAKHPCIQRPGSEFLQKRLQRGQKYFDSGDYNMAKASTDSSIKLPENATPVTTIEGKLLSKRH